MAKRSRKVTLPQLGGDHGTGTKAAMAGKEMQPILNEKGNNPNSMGRLRDVDQLAKLGLSLRQHQAAMEIRNAWSGVEKLSSGGELKEQVDSTPKPDATIAVQMDAQSRLIRAMKGVPSAMRDVVEHVCWHNLPISRIVKGKAFYNRKADLKVALDLAANNLGY